MITDKINFNLLRRHLTGGGQTSDDEILIFTHQDVLFKSDSVEKLISPLLKEKSNNIMCGAFGVPIDDGNECYSLDECCVAIKNKTWQKYKFNEQLCNGWHLYVVEMCIRLREAGGKCVAAETGIKHLSYGNVDANYMKLYRRLQKTYSDTRIITTCKSLPRNGLLFWIYYGAWKIKKALFGNYPLKAKLKGN